MDESFHLWPNSWPNFMVDYWKMLKSNFEHFSRHLLYCLSERASIFLPFHQIFLFCHIPCCHTIVWTGYVCDRTDILLIVQFYIFLFGAFLIKTSKHD